MAGINLSQTLQEKQAQVRGSFFDTGFYINLIVLVLVGAMYFGARWYNSYLDTKIAEADSAIATKTAQLEGKAAERVSDFRDRLDVIEKNLMTMPDPNNLFAAMEKAVLPAVRLTRYEEQWQDQAVVLEGVTDNLKPVAQLMLSIKKMSDISKVTVERIEYTDKGLIEFELRLKRVAPQL